MRVTKTAGDFNDIGDRACTVYCNGVKIADWTVADDFRRVVETPAGVHHGAVRIDLAPVAVPEVEPEPEVAGAPAAAKLNPNISARQRKAGR